MSQNFCSPFSPSSLQNVARFLRMDPLQWMFQNPILGEKNTKGHHTGVSFNWDLKWATNFRHLLIISFLSVKRKQAFLFIFLLA